MIPKQDQTECNSFAFHYLGEISQKPQNIYSGQLIH